MEASDILIVDDNSIIRRSLARQLQDFGASVTLARDGQEGLEIARSKRFDLVITDIEMPRLNGYELCKKLKESEGTRRTPVVILSSLEKDKDIDKGFQVGADAYISKSEAPKQLQETIEEVLKKSIFKRGRVILAVDDSSTIRTIVKKALEEAGFRVITAENGKRGLGFLSISQPDLILSDLDMPVMNGVEFCKAVHNDLNMGHIPFVVMSASQDRSIMRRMLQRGATAYLAKPFNPEQLVITIEKLLSDQFLLLLKERERLDTERKMMIASITSLIEALEARDPYTRGHSESVATIVTGMASLMNASIDEMETLGIAGRLHDLGKIGVPDGILLKPGGLTSSEFSIIKQHPIVGANILGPISTLNEIIPIIRHHHERFDGKGYPDGLKGEEIPFWARMTAVADTFHALTSNRPYRESRSKESALEIINDVRGSQLCPESVDLFFKWISKNG